MKEWLAFLSEQAITGIDAVALLVIVVGTIQVLIAVVRLTFRAASGQELRDAWLHYARWLVAGLTFQLAADILETSVTSSWQAIGKVGAIAVIRTFLNYFLDKDLAEIRERQARPRPPAEPER
jgi:uncharacterized membrane protein